MQLITQSEATAAQKAIRFTQVDSSDLQTRLSGTTGFTVRVIKGDGTSAAGGGTITEPDSTNAAGVMNYAPSVGDVDTLGPLTIRISKASVETREINALVVAFDPFSTSIGVLASVVDGSTRTVKGVLARLDALVKGKATGLNSATATYYADDGTTAIVVAAQDTTAGTRTAASTAGGD